MKNSDIDIINIIILFAGNFVSVTSAICFAKVILDKVIKYWFGLTKYDRFILKKVKMFKDIQLFDENGRGKIEIKRTGISNDKIITKEFVLPNEEWDGGWKFRFSADKLKILGYIHADTTTCQSRPRYFV